jgi:hypothetical protein
MPVRFLRGVEAPAIAALKAFGPESISGQLKEIDTLRESGMKKRGTEGFDVMGLLGSILPGSAIGSGISKSLPAAHSVIGRVASGAVTGGATAGAMPVQGGDELSADKLRQIGSGAVAGGAIPLVSQAIMGAKAAVEPFYEKGREAIIGRTLNTASGGRQSEVANALAQAREIVPGSKPTVGQAAGNAGIASLERAAGAISPESTVRFAERAAEQNAARVNALSNIAGNDDILAALRQHREVTTSPLRQGALSTANIPGMEVPKLDAVIAAKEKAIAEALARKAQATPQTAPPPPDALRSAKEIHGYTPPSAPLRTAAEKAALSHDDEVVQKSFAQLEAAQAAKAALPKPLEASDITKRISGIASQPGLRASDVVSKSLAHVKEKINALANEQGIVEANDLYMVRKELGNVVKKYAEESKNFDQRLTAGLVKDVQGYIDDAITKTGATGWRDYLTKYQELSRPIDQMKVGQAIADKAVDRTTGEIRPTAYNNALTDKTAQAATNYKQASLEGTMNPRQMGVLNAISDDLIRAVQARNMAGTAGSDTVKKLAYSNLIDRAGVPTFLREFAPTQAAGNFLARGADSIYGGANREIAETLAKTLLNPQEAARMMRQVGPSRFAQIIDAMIQQGSAGAGVVAGRNDQ